MSFNLSAGVYGRIVDQSFVVNAGGLLSGGVVISAKRGPVEVKTVTSAREFLDTYGIPTQDNPSMFSALRFLNRAGMLSVRRVVNDAAVAVGSLNGLDGEPIYTFTAANPGAWGNAVRVNIVLPVAADLEITVDGQDPQPVTSATNFSLPFTVNVYEGDDLVESFEVSASPNAKNGYGNNIYIEEVINNRSRFIRVNDEFYPWGQNESMYDYVSNTSFYRLSGGGDDTIAPTSGMINAAWDEFLNPDDVPAQLLINAGWAVPAVQTKMLSVADSRKDAVAILDVPEDVAGDVQGMVNYRRELGANTYVGGLYGGWLRVYDQYNDREVTIPASGDVAAVFVHTVEVAERWDAPAGLQRGIIPNAIGVSKVFTEGERDLLYTNGINPVTTYGGAAAVIWGQKTLQVQASALDRFNVTNLVLWLNIRMVEALQPFVFQPNTEFTRDSVNFLLSSFLDNIRLRGGLYAFHVDTSTEINTPYAIDNNQMMVDVYVQPTKTAEFLRVSTIITPTGVQLG